MACFSIFTVLRYRLDQSKANYYHYYTTFFEEPSTFCMIPEHSVHNINSAAQNPHRL